MVRLSKRLAAVSEFVPADSFVVDIGTDHAYLPIYLVESGKVQGALASDVKTGPLERAGSNIEAAGLSGRIKVRLSDGLSDIASGDGDVLVIAGMGGLLMLRILQEGDLSGFGTFVLSPQSDLPAFRAGLMELGIRIEKETLVYEDGKYYPVLCAEHGTDEDDDPVRLRYGKHLVPEAMDVMRDYLAAEHETLKEAMRQIAEHAAGHEEAKKRYGELSKKLLLNEEAQKRTGRNQIWNETAELR